MKQTFLIFSMLLMVLQSYAQSVVTGVYVDSTTMESIPYATVALFKGDATQPESVSLTTLNGSFELRTKANGNYRLSITNMGNKPVNEPFVADGKKIDFGKILAVTATERLDELTVVAQKPIIKAEVDRVTYDVEADPEAPAKNALDMLRKMPHITVDGEDNIQLNGSSSFKIHVNGKPSSLFESDPGKTLKNIPATAIKNVEVITSPGAKYDAEGVGGIINIVMSTGSNMDGYTATIAVNGELPKGINTSLNAMVKKGKLTASGRAIYNKRISAEPDIYALFEYAPFDGSNQYSTKTTQSQGNRFGMFNIDLSYEIDTMRLINVSWNYRDGKGYNENIGSYVEQIIDSVKALTFKADIKNDWVWSGNELTLNYERKFNRNHALTLSLRGYNSPKGGGENNSIYYDWNITGKSPMLHLNSYADNDESSSEYTGQLDYIGSFGNMHSLEAGAKYTLRNNDSESLTRYERLIEPVVTDSSYFSSLEHQQNIFAAYTSYTLKLQKFSAKLGLRLENNKLDAESVYGNKLVPFSYNETDLVPSVFLSYNLKPTSTIKLSYNMRIMRPGIGYLNPYRDESMPLQVSYGNMELDSEHHHSFSASYSSFSQLVMFNASLSYDFCNNDIITYRFLNGNIQESTYGNYGKNNNLKLNIYTNLTLSKSTSVMFSGGLTYQHIESDKIGEKEDGFQPSIYVSLNQNLPLGIKSTLYGFYMGKGVQLQGDGFDIKSYGLSLTRSMLNDRLTFSLSSNSFFSPTLKVRQVQETQGSRSIVKADFPIWQVRFGVNFRLGELKASVKKVRSVESDDVIGGGEKSESDSPF